MATPNQAEVKKASVRDLPRNVWAVSLTSFFMDISSEMVINVLPLFLASVLGVKTSVIGLIEGVAEATASILKLFSGWLSDRVGERKWLAVAGYGISALAKPFFYFASTWESGRGCALGRPRGQGHPHRAARCAGGRLGRSEAARAGLRLPPGRRHRRRDAGACDRAGRRVAAAGGSVQSEASRPSGCSCWSA